MGVGVCVRVGPIQVEPQSPCTCAVHEDLVACGIRDDSHVRAEEVINKCNAVVETAGGNGIGESQRIIKELSAGRFIDEVLLGLCPCALWGRGNLISNLHVG